MCFSNFCLNQIFSRVKTWFAFNYSTGCWNIWETGFRLWILWTDLRENLGSLLSLLGFACKVNQIKLKSYSLYRSVQLFYFWEEEGIKKTLLIRLKTLQIVAILKFVDVIIPLEDSFNIYFVKFHCYSFLIH